MSFWDTAWTISLSPDPATASVKLSSSHFAIFSVEFFVYPVMVSWVSAHKIMPSMQTKPAAMVTLFLAGSRLGLGHGTGRGVGQGLIRSCGFGKFILHPRFQSGLSRRFPSNPAISGHGLSKT